MARKPRIHYPGAVYHVILRRVFRGQYIKLPVIKYTVPVTRPDGQVYLFHHGINNTEEKALGTAAEQRSPQELEQGVYVVINPYTGNVISEVLYAAWDKTMGPVFGISNASEMRNEFVMQAGAQGYVVNEVNASRGNITSYNGQQQLDREGITNAPISQVQMNGSPINAQDMQGVMDRTTGGKAQVYQSTHQNDWKGCGVRLDILTFAF